MRYFAFLMLVALSVSPVYADRISENLEISSHRMNVVIVPESNSISVEDMVSISAPVQGQFSFALNKNLTITEIESLGATCDYETSEWIDEDTGEVSGDENLMLVSVNFPSETNQFRIVYSGVINDPINPSKALSRARGDYTSGLISPDGVYLSSESGWYPDTLNSMALYNVIVNLPDNWSSVCQGDLVAPNVWESSVPSDGCVLVANQYFVTSRVIGDVTCSTYFYQDNPDLANQFLDKLEIYLPEYEKLFGSYPYSRFDVVENFFSTGYGMPGFTLLGSHVLMMPYATAEGSLGHELVHCWWGNYVYPNWENGNWCEGLTAFSTNYLWNEIAVGEEKAKQYRFDQMMKYSIQVAEEDEYPVRKFRSKWTELDGHIGYGKASGIFIQLREILGDDIFFGGLKLMTERFGGKHADWNDFRDVWEELSGKDLHMFFETWVDGNGLPKLRVEDVSVKPDGQKWVTKFSVVQDEPHFAVYLPYVLRFEGGGVSKLPVEFKVFDGSRINISLKTAVKPVAIEIDPDHYIFRRLDVAEIPPCLNNTLRSEKLSVILPSGGTDEMVQVRSYTGMEEKSVHDLFSGLGDMITESGNDANITQDVDYLDDRHFEGSFLILGNTGHNAVVREAVSAGRGSFLPDYDFEILEDGFRLNGKEYKGDEYSILVSIFGNGDPDTRVTFYFGNSPQSVFKANYIFFYGWDSWVVFENGNPVDRGTWETKKGSLYVELDN